MRRLKKFFLVLSCLMILNGCTSEVNADSVNSIFTSAVKGPVTSVRNNNTSSMPVNNIVDEPTTPYGIHKALSVKDGDLVDSRGEKYQLYGMSTHGIGWFPQYVNIDTFKTLRDDWNTNCVRLALYTAEYNGYSTGGDKANLKEIVKNGVNYATELGMYVIVDWHILSDQNPNVHKSDAIDFFKEISAFYKDYDNIIYEICNEPNGNGDWNSIKAYANEVIPVIRANDGNAVIIVGTPCWSQEIDKPLNDPLKFDNIMYSLHFYAATHKDFLRQRLEACRAKNLPVFISEFGICDASGNGSNDFNEMTKWKELIDKYNISYMNWNLANKNETSSAIASNCNRVYGWSEAELSDSGKWIRNCFKNEN